MEESRDSTASGGVTTRWGRNAGRNRYRGQSRPGVGGGEGGCSCWTGWTMTPAERGLDFSCEGSQRADPCLPCVGEQSVGCSGFSAALVAGPVQQSKSCNEVIVLCAPLAPPDPSPPAPGPRKCWRHHHPASLLAGSSQWEARMGDQRPGPPRLALPQVLPALPSQRGCQ